VHAYVTGARIVDVVLFTATQSGTFAVTSDLHPEEAGQFTAFEPPQPATSPVVPALSRTLADVKVTYRPSESDCYVTFLVSEQRQTETLAAAAATPELLVNAVPCHSCSARWSPDKVHHRASSLRWILVAISGRRTLCEHNGDGT
jgi:hypothetical protein